MKRPGDESTEIGFGEEPSDEDTPKDSPPSEPPSTGEPPGTSVNEERKSRAPGENRDRVHKQRKERCG